MPGINTTPPQTATRNTIGDIYPNQAQVLYGSRISDILSFLPDDLKTKYNALIGGQNLNARYGGQDTLVNIKTGTTQTRAQPGKPADPHIPDAYWQAQDIGRSYEKAQSDILDSQIKAQAAALGTGRELTSNQLQEINNSLRLDQVNNATVGTPTLSDDQAKQFAIAAGNNPYYMVQLSKAIDDLVHVYGNRLQFGTVYRNSLSGNVSLIPDFQTDTIPNRLQAAATILYQLVAIGALKPADELQIRPIDINTGEFQVSQDDINYNKQAKILKLPLKGQFQINTRITNVGRKNATFTGVDVKVAYAIGYKVGNLEGMTMISWSIHRGKPDAPTGDVVAPTARARGRRTIAGSMVFAMFDEHPITAIYPLNFFPQDPDFQIDSSVRNEFMMPDALPPFDIFVIMTNEYGYAAGLSLYGVEIMDDGGTLNMNDLVNEEVIQYTAKSIDLLHPTKVGADGLIDPFELASLQTNKIFTRRSQIAGYDDQPAFFKDYDKYSQVS